MSERRFKAGDVVRLKSGGPLMTVTNGCYPAKEYSTIWFSTRNELQESSFDDEELVPEPSPIGMRDPVAQVPPTTEYYAWGSK